MFSGGLSNHIFHCSLPPETGKRSDEPDDADCPSDVLLRLYGGSQNVTERSITAYITSHVIDNVVFTILSERGLGPRLYGVFPEGR